MNTAPETNYHRKEVETPQQTRTRRRLLKELRPIFDAALEAAKDKLDLSKNESLYRVTQNTFDAFQEARKAMDARGGRKGKVPFIAGSDPHNQEAANISDLSVALATVYGFASGLYIERNPKSIETLKEMQVMAKEIHKRGLCIFT